MPKQSATDPKFRCNGCKEFHSAPPKKAYYQCATHGFLCTKHLVKKGNKVKGGWTANNPYKMRPINERHIGKCKIPKKGSNLLKKGNLDGKRVEQELCLTLPIIFNWHKDVDRWIEEGREEEEKAKAKPKTKSKTKPDYVSEIKVLMDLFEQDILTKEQFLSQLKEKLGL